MREEHRQSRQTEKEKRYRQGKVMCTDEKSIWNSIYSTGAIYGVVIVKSSLSNTNMKDIGIRSNW